MVVRKGDQSREVNSVGLATAKDLDRLGTDFTS